MLKNRPVLFGSIYTHARGNDGQKMEHQRKTKNVGYTSCSLFPLEDSCIYILCAHIYIYIFCVCVYEWYTKGISDTELC